MTDAGLKHLAGLVNLQQGNLPFATDFRQVYATILDQWLGVPSRQILGQEFAPVQVLRGA